MQKRRTKHFRLTLLTAIGLSAATLVFLAIFGARIAAYSVTALVDGIFVVLALAAASFLIFSFLPYFHGDKRWYSISALLTVAFFGCAAILWQIPAVGGVL